MSEETTEESAGRPPSSYVVLLALALLGATALALVVAMETVANWIAVAAYVALVVGVGLRLVEFALGDRIDRPMARIGRRIRAGTAGRDTDGEPNDGESES